MTIEKVTITPELAKDLLQDYNKNNRNISQIQVARIAKDMKDGNWQVNGETIKFAKNNYLIDGQHRLQACVLADTPFETYVIYDLDNSVIDSVDTGRRRSDNDILKLNGFKSSRELVTVCRRLILVEDGQHPVFTFEGSHKGTITTRDLLDYCQTHKHEVDIIQTAKARHGVIRNLGVTTTLISFMFILFERSAGTDTATEFFEKLYDTNRPFNASPADLLRKTYWEQAAKRKVGERKIAYTDPILMIKAWNAYLDGKVIKRITVSQNDYENPPAIKELIKSMWR